MKRIASVLLLTLSASSYAQITEQTFRETLKEFEELYTSRLQNDLQLKLSSITGIWTPKSIVAFSSARVIPSEKEARVQIDGDFAQKSGANKEAFVLIVCHEFGHLYKDRAGISKLLKEGQADYFTPQCALDYFKHVPDDVKRTDIMRVESGIASFAKVMNVDLKTLYDSEDHDFVAHSSLHPTPSCRVKAFLAGLYKQAMPQCAIGIHKS